MGENTDVKGDVLASKRDEKEKLVSEYEKLQQELRDKESQLRDQQKAEGQEPEQ